MDENVHQIQCSLQSLIAHLTLNTGNGGHPMFLNCDRKKSLEVNKTRCMPLFRTCVTKIRLSTDRLFEDHFLAAEALTLGNI